MAKELDPFEQSGDTLQTITVNNPALLAMLTKLTTRNNDKYGSNKLEEDIQMYKSMVNDNNRRTSNSDEILKLFPDAAIAEDIIVSSIISPDDMMTTNLIFESPSIELPDEIKLDITNRIKDYVEDNYKLTRDLKVIVSEALFRRGAYVTVIIPEASMDEVINNYNNLNGDIPNEFGNDGKLKASRESREDSKLSVESFKNKLISGGMVKDLNSKSIDNITSICNSISITDDASIIKSRNSVTSKRLSTESNNKDKDKGAITINLDSIFTEKTELYKENLVIVKNVKDTLRETIGKPLVMKVPASSIIPVYPIGEPDNHLGYFLLVDNKGIPLVPDPSYDPNNLEKDSGGYKVTSNVYNANTSPIEQSSNNAFGYMRDPLVHSEMERVFSDLMDEAIKHKLKAKDIEDFKSVDMQQSIYKVMFQRSLEGKETKMVYLPKDLVNYFAYNYRQNGTGESLFERVMTLYSIRAMLLMSEIIGYIRNSIPISQVSVGMPEDETDPMGAMQQIQDLVMSGRKSMFPFNTVNPIDMTDWIHKYGYEFKLKYKGIEDYDIEISDVSKEMKLPDSEIDEKINALILHSFGLNPEMIKPGFEAEFATTINSRNLSFAKRTMTLQNVTSNNLSDFVSKLIINDGDLRTDLKIIIYKNIKKIREHLIKNNVDGSTKIENITDEDLIEYIIRKYSNGINVSLPRPKTNDAPAMLNSLKYNFDIIEEVVGGVFDSGMFSELVIGDAANSMDNVKSMIVGSLKLKYVSESNIIPELSEFFDESKNSLTTSIGRTAMNLISNYVKLLSENQPNFKVANEVLKKLMDENGGSEDDGYGDDSGSDDDDGDDSYGDSDDSDDNGDLDGDSGDSGFGSEGDDGDGEGDDEGDDPDSDIDTKDLDADEDDNDDDLDMDDDDEKDSKDKDDKDDKKDDEKEKEKEKKEKDKKDKEDDKDKKDKDDEK